MEVAYSRLVMSLSNDLADERGRGHPPFRKITMVGSRGAWFIESQRE